MNCSAKNSQRKGALHLTQKVDYGIIMLVNLAKNHQKGPTSIKNISEDNNISFSFLQKIARNFQTAGLIKAERGKYGGYKLTKEAQALSLKEIIEALEGPIALAPCLADNGHKCKSEKNCCIKSTLSQLNEEIKEYFLQKTLADFTLTS